MKFALACASHTPLLLDTTLADATTCDAVRASFAQLADFVRDFAPDQIVQFSPDHFHGFHYDNMPSFCVGMEARSFGDWNTATGPLKVDGAYAMALAEAAHAQDIDVAVSYDMEVDHGFVQMWETMFGSFADLPIVPVFINSVAWPIPAYRRARLLGQAIGRHAAMSGRRVLFAASGGLSHDPVVPTMQGATAETRQRLLGRVPVSPEAQARREQQIRDAAHAAHRGNAAITPLNPDWDLRFLQMLSQADWPSLDALVPRQVAEVAGSGANEVLCWVAAMAALQAASGDFRVIQNDYLAIPGWIAGMSHLAATTA